MQISKHNAFLGQAGELLVCFDFVVRGFEAMVNPFPGSKADVLVNTARGGILRCQVKSTGGPKKITFTPNMVGRGTEKTRVFGCASKTKQKYRFGLGGGSAAYDAAGIDLFAFVALDAKEVLYLTTAELSNGNDRGKKAFGLQAFTSRAAGSLDRCLAILVPA